MVHLTTLMLNPLKVEAYSHIELCLMSKMFTEFVFDKIISELTVGEPSGDPVKNRSLYDRLIKKYPSREEAFLRKMKIDFINIKRPLLRMKLLERKAQIVEIFEELIVRLAEKQVNQANVTIQFYKLLVDNPLNTERQIQSPQSWNMITDVNNIPLSRLTMLLEKLLLKTMDKIISKYDEQNVVKDF